MWPVTGDPFVVVLFFLQFAVGSWSSPDAGVPCHSKPQSRGSCLHGIGHPVILRICFLILFITMYQLTGPMYKSLGIALLKIYVFFNDTNHPRTFHYACPNGERGGGLPILFPTTFRMTMFPYPKSWNLSLPSMPKKVQCVCNLRSIYLFFLLYCNLL